MEEAIFNKEFRKLEPQEPKFWLDLINGNKEIVEYAVSRYSKPNRGELERLMEEDIEGTYVRNQILKAQAAETRATIDIFELRKNYLKPLVDYLTDVLSGITEHGLRNIPLNQYMTAPHISQLQAHNFNVAFGKFIRSFREENFRDIFKLVSANLDSIYSHSADMNDAAKTLLMNTRNGKISQVTLDDYALTH